MVYELSTKLVGTVLPEHNIPVYEGPHCRDLLLDPIVQQLHSLHGNDGMIEIWREIAITIDTNNGAHQHVRAYHQYDKYGPYFDWVNVKDSAVEATEVHYVPAKVLLLYRINDVGYCLCWKALQPTDAESKHETNVSARWKMGFRPNGLPLLTCVRLDDVVQPIYVYQHFHDKPHQFPQKAVSVAERESRYIVEEAYERYSWALNFLDQRRWDDDT